MFSLYSPTGQGFVGHIDNVFLGEITNKNFEEVTVTAKSNNSVVGTKVIEFDADTDTTSQDAVFNIDDIDEVLITTADTTKTIKVNTICEPKYNTYILTFKNRYGVDEDLYFFKKSSREIKVKAEEFRTNQFGQRSNGVMTRSVEEFGKNGTETTTLNSGFVIEALNSSFKQLMLSEEVSMFDFNSNTTQAVKVSQSSINFKTITNDKLINYTIEVEASNNLIDDVV